MNVRRVTSRRDLAAFVDVPWTLFDGPAWPQWVPPLRVSVLNVLDARKNPFFREADVALFVAERDGSALGRIAAIENRWLPEDDPLGRAFFGYLEVPDDHEVTRALIEAAGAWLRGRGHARMVGPLHPSTNYESGLLVDGFDHPPTFMTPWNPPYYERRLRDLGMKPIQDLLGWHLRIDDVQEALQRRLGALAKRVLERGRMQLERLDLKRFDRTMERCWQVYRGAWEGNWGFCPPSLDEFMFIAKELQPLLVRDGTIGVVADGELVGFGLFLPDYNRALQSNRNGKLLPLGWWRLLRYRSRAPWVRTILTGVLEEYRRLGVLPVILHEAISRAPPLGVTDVEFSWVLEQNEDANRALEHVGADVYRRWRIFEAALED